MRARNLLLLTGIFGLMSGISHVGYGTTTTTSATANTVSAQLTCQWSEIQDGPAVLISLNGSRGNVIKGASLTSSIDGQPLPTQTFDELHSDVGNSAPFGSYAARDSKLGTALVVTINELSGPLPGTTIKSTYKGSLSIVEKTGATSGKAICYAENQD